VTEDNQKAFDYPGGELELFAGAHRWRSYWQSRVRGYLGDEVLEVGAGIGSITTDLAPASVNWTALEPDRHLAERIPRIRTRGGEVRVVVGTITALEPREKFDTVLYIDVLEHIEDDSEELKRATRFLRPGGRLVVLVPAFPFLFSAFDAAVGHHRRYTVPRLKEIRPASLRELKLEHLDAMGFLSAATNRLLLQQKTPGPTQIRLWDRALIPASRRIDPILGRRLGKSIVAVWERVSEPDPAGPND